MATVIQELARMLKELRGWPIRVECQPEEMLITISFVSGRSQAVRVWTDLSLDRRLQLVRLQSRASVARDYKTVHSAMLANANLQWGGLGIDLSTQPPALDVLYSFPAENIPFTDFTAALQKVAAHADAIEQKTIGGDDY